MMTDVVFENGDKASIATLDFRLAIRLKNIIEKELVKNNFDISAFSGGDMTLGVMQKILQIVMCIDASDEVFEIYMQCFARCVYNGHKITENTFESIKARENYYELIKHLIEINFTPFFKGLASTFVDIIAKVKVLEAPK